MAQASRCCHPLDIFYPFREAEIIDCSSTKVGLFQKGRGGPNIFQALRVSYLPLA